MNFLWVLFVFYAFAFVIDLFYVQPFRKRRAVKQGAEYESGAISFGIRVAVPLFLFVLTIRTFLFDVLDVPTNSMEPALTQGELIVVNRFAYGLKSPLTERIILERAKPQPGEVFVFQYPREPRTLYVKRVLGVPGDHIQIDHNVVRRNGNVLFDPSQASEELDAEYWLSDVIYISNDDASAAPGPSIDVVVPPDHYFALGDNMDHSEDSRHWGFVGKRHLVGRVYQ